MRVMLGVLLLALATPAWAQDVNVANLNRAFFAWTVDAASAPIKSFNFYCNGQLVYILADPAARAIAVKDVVKQPGSYSCIVRPANDYGESEDSPVLLFRAGFSPHPVPAVTIETR